MNRKLIRPNLTNVKLPEKEGGDNQYQQVRRDGNGYGNNTARRTANNNTQPPSRTAPKLPADNTDSGGNGRKVPATETNAEIFYYKKQMDGDTLMVIVLQDNEKIEGTIEWYDRHALKINRAGKPNLMLLKHNIKYMYKADEFDS